MPSTLTRFVLKEVMRWYLVGVALFVILQMTDLLSSTVGTLLMYHPPLSKTLGVFAAKLPKIVNQTLAMAVPFSILLAFSRMQSDSELKAISAAGIRPLKLVWPLVLPFALVGAFAFYNAGTLVPAGEAKWTPGWWSIYKSPVPPPRQNQYTYAPPGALYYAGSVVNDRGGVVADLQGVLVQRGEETITASSGKWDSRAHTWTLSNPWITRPGQNPVQTGGVLVVPQNDTLLPPPADAREVSNKELRAALAGTTLTPTKRREYTFQLATRFADPLTPIVFALAAGVLGLLIRNRAAAFAAVLVFIVCFYALWSTVPQLARAGAVNPTLAAWVPNLAFLLVTGVLAWRLR